MSSVTIGWDETAPTDARNAGLGASDIRSILTNLRGGLAAEHVWGSTAGLHGAHVAGSARAFYGTASRVSSSDTDGRLMLTSDSSRLYHTGSADTVILGGQTVVFGPSTYSTRFSTVTQSAGQAWAMVTGVGAMGTSGATTINFGQSFVTYPTVFIGQNNASQQTQQPVANFTLSVSAISVINYGTATGTQDAPTSAYSFAWVAFGIVAS